MRQRDVQNLVSDNWFRVDLYQLMMGLHLDKLAHHKLKI